MNLNYYNTKFLTWLIYFVPISLISGSLILNLNLILIAIFLFIYFFLNKNFFYYLNLNWVKVAILILICQILSSIINDVNLDSLIRSIGLIKFITLTTAILIIFELNYKNFENFTRILFLVALFVIVDSLIQFSFGKNIFGNEYTLGRLTSIFGDEKIVGAFLAKIGFLILILPFMIIKNTKYLNIIIFTTISILLITILLSGERMASLLFILGITIYYFYKSFFNYKNSFYFVIIGIIILVIFSSSDNVLKRFKEINHERFGLTKELKINNSVWGAHFLAAYEIFKNYPILGVGPKNFRLEVCKKKYENINSTKATKRCSTHPHNIILEILSEHGIIGMILFLILLYTILKGSNLFNEIQFLTFISLLIFVWPIGTSGSIFTSWNGTFLWVNFAFFLFIKRCQKFKKNKYF